MADRVRKVNYCYLTVSSRAGQGVKVLSELKAAGVKRRGPEHRARPTRRDRP